MVYIHTAFFICPSVNAKNRPGFLFRKPRRFIMLYSWFLKLSRNYLRGFLIAACSALYKQRAQETHIYVIYFFKHSIFYPFRNIFRK